MSSFTTKPVAAKPIPAWRHRGIRYLLLLAGAYLGVIIVLMALENFLLFRPMKASEEWIGPPNSRVQDVQLALDDGTRIHAWWCPNDDAPGAILYCHGNAGNLSHRAGAIAMWQQFLNQSVLIFDYPGYGKSEGKPTEQGCYAAADAAYEWLTSVGGMPSEQVMLYGDSLGGGVATELATRKPHRALILVKTFTSIPDMAQMQYPWLPAKWLVRNKFDNLGKIGQCPRPIFIAHGDHDSLVPYSHGEKLFQAAKEPKQIFTLKGQDHNDFVGPDFFAALQQFLAKVDAKHSHAATLPASAN
ncbi:MAG TPA: alpha/beta hydrolase [Gemmataceae bacterium]|nr:alpha/beta hydrolase [Gemmataceae bacterium]